MGSFKYNKCLYLEVVEPHYWEVSLWFLHCLLTLGVHPVSPLWLSDLSISQPCGRSDDCSLSSHPMPGQPGVRQRLQGSPTRISGPLCIALSSPCSARWVPAASVSPHTHLRLFRIEPSPLCWDSGSASGWKARATTGLSYLWSLSQGPQSLVACYPVAKNSSLLGFVLFSSWLRWESNSGTGDTIRPESEVLRQNFEVRALISQRRLHIFWIRNLVSVELMHNLFVSLTKPGRDTEQNWGIIYSTNNYWMPTICQVFTQPWG